ncbi:MAG: adenosine deaminase [Actinobacteria bacterium]|nr:adenosine deaminase [Actinomycetota bacterium]
MTEQLSSLPKVELHVHLEGSISAATATELSRRHGEDPDSVLPLVEGRYPERFTTFQEFVELYLAVTRQVRTPDDLATVAAEFARQQAAQNVRYTEATFTAATLDDFGLDTAAMWEALRDGLAGQETDVRLIVDAVRNVGPRSGHRTVALVEEGLEIGAPIVGLGLAGDENSAPVRDFTMLREAADRLGLGLTVHAGETGPASNIREALDDIGADRIGHGVAAVNDPQLLHRLVAEQVVLEVCPSSNVVLQVVPDLDDHPFPQLWRRGANVTINSDDPPFFATTLTDELAHAARLAALDDADLAELQRRAARGAFCEDELRSTLFAQIDAWERKRGRECATRLT